MARYRKQNEERLLRYEHFTPSDGDFTCFYCGVPSDSIDHQPPLSHIDTAHEDDEVVTVPCCRECNVVIGPKYTPTLFERHRLLKLLLEKRYWKVLIMPEWNEDDIGKLGIGLREFMNQSARHKLAIEIRLAYNGGINSWNNK